MAVCSNCKETVPDNAAMCVFCGTKFKNYDEKILENIMTSDIPICHHCGYMGKMKPGNIFRPKDYVILILTAWGCIIPLAYAAYVYLTRSDPSKRNEICPNCKKVYKYADKSKNK